MAKDEKYYVEMRVLEDGAKYLNRDTILNTLSFNTKYETKYFQTTFTLQEIKDLGMSEVFYSDLFRVIGAESGAVYAI